MKFKFFRGIAVSDTVAEQTIDDIQRAGLSGNEGEMKVLDSHPGNIEQLFSKSDLSIDDTRSREQEVHTICACGEFYGAAYYALEHNRNLSDNIPLLIEFESDEKSFAVDGRDFLYPVFQMGDPALARDCVTQAFGEAVLRYADLAWHDTTKDIALCDLAIHDPDVIRAHYDNKLVLGGRCGTVFRNAFLVHPPIPPSAITRIRRLNIDIPIPQPEVKFSDLLRKRN